MKAVENLYMVAGMSKVPNKKSQRKSRRGDPAGSLLDSRRNWLRIAICAGLFAATCLLYLRTHSYPFVNFDDGEYVFENPHITSGVSWTTARWAATSAYAGNWHPLTWISHAADYQIFGLNAGGHHISNVLLHGVNVCLLFLCLVSMTRRYWESSAVALLFALHPLQVESVAWVAERKNLLCTTFFLAVLIAYTRYTRRPGWQRYLIVTILFVAALASKPMAVTIPLVLLLLDYWPLERLKSENSSRSPEHKISFLLLEKAPWFALSLASGIVTVLAQRVSGAIANPTGWPLIWRVENAIHSYAMYLVSCLAPVRLAPFYPGAQLHWWQVFSAACVLVVVGATIWRFKNGRPYLLFGSLWFVITLVPVIGLIQVGAQARADRYMYIPLVGILAAVVWSLADVDRSGAHAWQWKTAAAGVAAIVFVTLTSIQIGYWHSSLDLWQHTLAVTENNAVAEENYAVGLLDLSREDEAYPHFERVIMLRPDDAVALLNTGNYLERQGLHTEAIQRFLKVRDTSHDPAKLTGAYRGLGVSYAQLGDGEKARENFLQAMRLNPGGTTEMYNLALLELRASISKVQNQISKKPSPEAYLQLGQLLQEDQQSDAALDAYERALRLNPHLADARAAIDLLKQNLARN